MLSLWVVYGKWIHRSSLVWRKWSGHICICLYMSVHACTHSSIPEWIWEHPGLRSVFQPRLPNESISETNQNSLFKPVYPHYHFIILSTQNCSKGMRCHTWKQESHPRTHMVERDNHSHNHLLNFHMYACICVSEYTQTHTL